MRQTNVIGILLLYLRPGVVDIPLVVSQVDVEDGCLRVDWDWVDDCYSPREAVDQLVECLAVLLENPRRLAGVVEMCQCEVAGKRSVKR